jgi:hypothetical protein
MVLWQRRRDQLGRAERLVKEREVGTTRILGCEEGRDLASPQAILALRPVTDDSSVNKAGDFLDTMLQSTYTTANAPSGNQRYISRASLPLVGTCTACAGRRVRGSDPWRRNTCPDPARARLLRVGANRHPEVSRRSISPLGARKYRERTARSLISALVFRGTWANSSVG